MMLITFFQFLISSLSIFLIDTIKYKEIILTIKN